MIINTVAKETVIEFEERKSKFIGYIKPVDTVADAEKFIKSIKEQHPAATHNVPLYRVIENGQEHMKYNDDGEPSGTAGKPMADIAVIQHVFNFAMVATRYFGGVKLGAGGLIRMYAKTAKLAIAEAGIVPPSRKYQYRLIYGYDMTSKVNSFIYQLNAEIVSEDYGEQVSQIIEVDMSQEADMQLYNVNIEKIK